MTGSDEATVDAAVAEAITVVTGTLPARDAGFFEAGVTSAQVITIHELVQRLLGREFPVTVFFRYPSRRAVSRHLAGGFQAAPASDDVPPARPGAWTAQARRDIRNRIRDRQR